MSLRYFKCRDLKVYYVSLCLLVKVVLWFQIHYALLKSSQNSEIENVTGVGCDIHLHKHNNFFGGEKFCQWNNLLSDDDLRGNVPH